MNAGKPRAELLLLWHHHQPDYRSPREGRALLPWARLHAVKDYLDMALRLEAHPRVRATFNFVPSLLDQLEDFARGGGEALFDPLARPAAELSAAERREVTARCAQPPPRMRGRWPRYESLCRRAQRAGAAGLAGRELEALEAWFLVAWLDPMFHREPEVSAALSEREGPSAVHRDALLGLHARLVSDVVPAYRRLAGRGQIELSASPYAHPILPLLVDLKTAHRALPELHLPARDFAAPGDAARQIERALARHAEVFGAPPRGMWPSEGSVSPEVAALVAGAGLSWMASDEGVLWRSLSADSRRRDALYQSWRVPTPAGDVRVFFRDHELSDRIGFVYQHWEPADAVADFMRRLDRIGAGHTGAEPALVTVALDGENCWEHYADDGGPFLDRLYQALAESATVGTVTPSEIVARGAEAPAIENLHSGSWIDADFHIWIGHPEKNEAWDRIARARADLVAAGADEAAAPAAWHALHAAEGSDWFWWLGTDHHTPDKAVFDRILREHLAATYEGRGAEVPAWVMVPIVAAGVPVDEAAQPLGYVRPVVDGRVTSYFEWRGAGHRVPGSGGAMHQGESGIASVYFGFDAARLYLRVDPVPGVLGRAEAGLELAVGGGAGLTFRLEGLEPGTRALYRADGPPPGLDATATRAAVGEVIEIELELATLGLSAGDELTIGLRVIGVPEYSTPVSIGEDLPIRVPGPEDEAAQWSV